MTRSTKMPAIAVLALLICGCHNWEDVGGKWRVRRTETLPESGGSQPFLFRVSGLRKIPVLEFTYDYHYYGDDCIGFIANAGVFFACGDRRPIELLVPDRPYAEFASEGIVQESSNALTPFRNLLASPAMLKRRALTQPVVTVYDFTGSHEQIDLRGAGVSLPSSQAHASSTPPN